MIDLESLTTDFKDLQMVEPLGEGGQKWVWGAAHPLYGAVVLKIVKPQMDPERVRREVLAVRKLQSPRVPTVLAAGSTRTQMGECLWLLEERIFGESVRRVLQRGPLPVAEVVRLGLHVLEALTAAAALRIVHRDIKPENILRDNSGDYWLLDFGIARHLDLESVTATAALGGPATIGYAPPEQYRNKKVDIDGRTDLFALGVTMVEGLSGRHPFRDGARDGGEVVRRIEMGPLALPSIPADHDGRLGDFLSALTQRRMDCRPASAAEALSWLQELSGR